MFHRVPPDCSEKFQRALHDIIETFEGSVYAADNLISVGRNLTFLDDEQFQQSFWPVQSNDMQKSLAWRLHVLAWAASHGLHIEGDFVACGVFTGFQELVTCRYLDFQRVAKTFYLYDSFAGLPEDRSTDGERQMFAHYKQADNQQLWQDVQARYAAYPNVRFVKGFVPEIFETTVPQRIAYLHIDLGSSQSELLALERLFDRVSPAAIIVMELFGRKEHAELARSLTAFANARGHKILELPTGQGLIIKH